MKNHVLTLVLLLIVSSANAMDYVVYDIGKLHYFGSWGTESIQINNNNQVVAAVSTGTGQAKIVYWDNNQIDDIPFTAIDSYSPDIVHINDAGLVLCQSQWKSELWTKNNGAWEMLGETGILRATDLNNHGDVCSGNVYARKSDSYHPISTDIVGCGLNDSDVIVGQQVTMNTPPTSGDLYLKKPAMWANGAITLLTEPSGYDNVQALDINNQGIIIGEAYKEINGIPQNKYINTAFVWEDGQYCELPCDYDWVKAMAINDTDNPIIVGGYGKSSFLPGVTTACLWQNGELINLADFEVSDEGWKFVCAIDVNDEGWIVGYGTNPDGQSHHGFIMQPVPEPASLIIMAGGFLVIKKRR